VNTKEALTLAAERLREHAGHVFEVFTLSAPGSMDTALALVKIVSKLSPLVGNLIEFSVVELLNQEPRFAGGRWRRQDPDFPDTIYDGNITPRPGLEIKAWFPLATEITARFRDSQDHFASDQTYVALLAWLPESVIYGRPRLLDACVVSGLSVAKARDEHYHQPPDYVVMEPEDTRERTRNLQQTNTNGHRWQGSPAQYKQAMALVESWGPKGRQYRTDRAYQQQLRQLVGRFPYRLDTNFAKLDRIEHEEIEAFKERVMGRELKGMTLAQWTELLTADDPTLLRAALQQHLGIRA
jgi:hypothetical protein